MPTALEDLFPRVLPFAPGCSEPVAEFYLREAARELCTRTRLWRVNMAAIPTIANSVGPYAIALPVGADLVDIHSALIDGREVDVLPESALPNDWQTWPNTVRDCVFTTDKAALYAVPAYEAVRSIVLDVTLKPTEQVDELPDIVAIHHARAIADGALSNILLLPAYQNIQLAAIKAEQFNSAITKTAIKTSRGNSRFRPRQQGRYF